MLEQKYLFDGDQANNPNKVPEAEIDAIDQAFCEIYYGGCSSEQDYPSHRWEINSNNKAGKE